MIWFYILNSQWDEKFKCVFNGCCFFADLPILTKNPQYYTYKRNCQSVAAVRVYRIFFCFLRFFREKQLFENVDILIGLHLSNKLHYMEKSIFAIYNFRTCILHLLFWRPFDLINKVGYCCWICRNIYHVQFILKYVG